MPSRRGAGQAGGPRSRGQMSPALGRRRQRPSARHKGSSDFPGPTAWLPCSAFALPFPVTGTSLLSRPQNTVHFSLLNPSACGDVPDPVIGGNKLPGLPAALPLPAFLLTVNAKALDMCLHAAITGLLTYFPARRQALLMGRPCLTPLRPAAQSRAHCRVYVCPVTVALKEYMMHQGI